MNTILKQVKFSLVGCLVMASVSTPAWADDTEVFFGRNEPQNILLALDISGSMGDPSNVPITGTRSITHRDLNNHSNSEWVDSYAYTDTVRVRGDCIRSFFGYCFEYEYINESVDYYTHEEQYNTGSYKTKLQVMKEAVEVFVNGLSETDTRVGLLTYPHNSNYGRIRLAVEELDANGKQTLINTVNGLTAGGGTPITGALYEGARYFQGEDGYDSPVSVCPASNNIILLTDGSPGSTHQSTVTNTNTMLNQMFARDATADRVDCVLEPTNTVAGGRPSVQCAYDIASGLSTYNQVKQPNDSNEFITNSNIVTHTIGFSNDDEKIEYSGNDDNYPDANVSDYLKKLAELGGGNNESADNVDDLAAAFKSLTDSTAASGGFVAPSVPLSQSNRLETDDTVYLAMFQPIAKSTWPGNLKQYMYKTIDKTVDGETKRVEVLASVSSGQATTAAVSDQGGTFIPSAQSGWNNIIDGNTVYESGVAKNLTAENTTYSNLNSDSLTNNNNTVTYSNSSLDDAEVIKLLKTTTLTPRDLLKWFDNRKTTIPDPDNQGQTIVTNRMGDPLHSKPEIVDYDKDTRYGYFATNQGYLHAVDLKTGVEKWSFFPRDLFENVEAWAGNANLGNQNLRKYGLDGDITIHKIDSNNDNDYLDANDKVYLFVGMRRGGANYYVLDISNRNSPKMVFTVRNSDPSIGDYTDYAGQKTVEIPELGQTWSKPVIGKIKTGESEYKTVMIFGGGYDEYFDDLANPVNPDRSLLDQLGITEFPKGNNIYIVDLDMNNDGDIGSPSLLVDANDDAQGVAISNSIAGDLSVIDLDSNGVIDRLYAADVGGKIYRVDLPEDGDLSKLSGTTVADFSDTDANRFYGKPDVSYSVDQGQFFAAIAIGSGMRPNPLNTTTSDRFYVVFDKNAVTPTQNALITEGSLLNVTSKKAASGDDEERFYGFSDIKAAGKKGWYISLQPGEKVLSDSVTVDFKTLFTTYKPGSQLDTECSAAIGQNRVYGVGLLGGKPVIPSFDNNIEDSFLRDVDDRYVDLSYVGLAPSPTLLFPSETDVAVAVGTSIICTGDDCGFGSGRIKTVRWKQEK